MNTTKFAFAVAGPLAFFVHLTGAGPLRASVEWPVASPDSVGIQRRAIEALEQQGCTADGQVAATRSAGRMIAKVARARNVRYVVMDSPTATTAVRRIIEGELVGIVRRRLRDGTTLELVAGKP